LSAVDLEVIPGTDAPVVALTRCYLKVVIGHEFIFHVDDQLPPIGSYKILQDNYNLIKTPII